MMEFFVNFFQIVGGLLLFAAVIGALVGIGWFWVHHTGWTFLVFFVSGVSILSMPSSPLFGIIVLVVFLTLLVSGVLAGFGLIVGDVRGFGEKLTEKKSSNLHQHHDLGWHDHEYAGNHAHYGNHLSGPFYYIDERVIDQREGR